MPKRRKECKWEALPTWAAEWIRRLTEERDAAILEAERYKMQAEADRLRAERLQNKVLNLEADKEFFRATVIRQSGEQHLF